ncbi:hypothetical protein V6N11_039967 [Hibiscus sabdariffa]|uniref:Uncharacterized protein n=1 Tax=Hibiscus sabdariffa TaxID=183260 RepID=A0ABR2RG29_9ROSI
MAVTFSYVTLSRQQQKQINTLIIKLALKPVPVVAQLETIFIKRRVGIQEPVLPIVQFLVSFLSHGVP